MGVSAGWRRILKGIDYISTIHRHYKSVLHKRVVKKSQYNTLPEFMLNIARIRPEILFNIFQFPYTLLRRSHV